MSPRARLVLLGQSTLPILAALFVIAVTFTITPATLDHSPVAFETRGLVHHGFHYGLLAGALLGLAGALTTNKRGNWLELVGLILVTAAIVMNLTALIADSTHPDGEALSGVGLALRVGAIVQLGVRIWILVTRPTAEINVARERGEDA